MKIIKKYIISSIIPNATINKDFVSALKLKAKKDNAEFKLFITKLNNKESVYDVETVAEFIENKELKLCKNLKIYNFKQRHTVANPLTSLGYIKDSGIIPAPRILLESLPRHIKRTTLPRVIFTTGTICNPDDSAYKNTKTEIKSQAIHKHNGIGAVIVEVYENGFFNCRHLEWKSDCFYDVPSLSKVYKYTKNSITLEKNGVEAMVFGDRHLAHTDSIVNKETEKLIKRFTPKHGFEHDLVDGAANIINHHSLNNHILMKQNDLTPIQELETLMKFLNNQQNKFPFMTTNIVHSNHNDFYHRFLEDKKRIEMYLDILKESFFLSNKQYNSVLENINVLKELYEYKIKGLDPLEMYVKNRISIKNVKFLQDESSIIIKNWTLSEHGHTGVNGSRGGFQNLAFNSFIMGHTHTAKRTINGMWVGCKEVLDPAYCNKQGYSTWSHADAIIYPNGGATHIFYLNNEIENNGFYL